MPDIIAYDTERARGVSRASPQESAHAHFDRARTDAGRPRARIDCTTPKRCSTSPAAPGRFWSVIAPRAASFVALDNSAAMLREAIAHAPRTRTARGMRIRIPAAVRGSQLRRRRLHALPAPPRARDDRIRALREIRRVARLRRGRIAVDRRQSRSATAPREQRTAPFERGFGRRVCIERGAIERDFTDAGFTGQPASISHRGCRCGAFMRCTARIDAVVIAEITRPALRFDPPPID